MKPDLSGRTPREPKSCVRCEEEKGAQDFPVNNKLRDGLDSYCYSCRGELARARRQRAEGDDPARPRTYGMTRTEREAMRQWQQELCALCGDPSGLGLFRDSQVLLVTAAGYLDKHERAAQGQQLRPWETVVPPGGWQRVEPFMWVHRGLSDCSTTTKAAASADAGASRSS